MIARVQAEVKNNDYNKDNEKNTNNVSKWNGWKGFLGWQTIVSGELWSAKYVAVTYNLVFGLEAILLF